MAAFFSKVFPRKKDKEGSSKRNSSSSLLEGKFEAVSPTVSPSAAHFAESAQQLKERGREQEKEKDTGFSLFRPKSRPVSPPPDTRKTASNVPHLTLNLPVPKEERSRALGVVFEADPNDTSTLPSNVIGERRLSPLETLLLVKACSAAIINHGGLETLGVMHPFWYSASPEVQRKLISLFILSLAPKSPISTLSPSPSSAATNFNSELEYTRSPHDIAAVLRWALRHLRLEGESFGRASGQWNWYQTFAEAERASSYPPSAFSDALVPQIPPSHHQLLVATLEIVSSLASHSEHNGISGSKLTKFFGLWLLSTQRSEDGEDWASFYARWERAGRTLEHLFLAHIRDEMSRKKMPVRLAELVKGYPYHSRSPSMDSAPPIDDGLLPRPRFSTRQYTALFVRIETEVADAKATKAKPHPLRLISDALKSDLELKDAQYSEVWSSIRKAALASEEPDPILVNVDGYPSLTRVFADETTRLLSFVPAESGTASSSVPTIRLPRPPRRRSSSLNSPTQSAQANGNGKASTNGSAQRSPTSPVVPTSPSSPKDWTDFSSAGFGESTLGLDFAKTLLDKDVEVTDPPRNVQRKTSKKRKPSPRRSSVDSPDPSSATRAAELTTPTVPKAKSTIVSLIKLDEAFIDFWSDALVDPIASDWPNFVVAQLKTIPGAEVDGKPLGWLVLEQRFVTPPPPPKTAEEAPSSPVTATRRASSPKPSVRSEFSQRRVSTLSAIRKRFTFSTPSQSLAGVPTKPTSTDGKTVSRKPVKANVGEMGEMLPEVEEKPETKEEPTKEAADPAPEVPAVSTEASQPAESEPVPEPAALATEVPSPTATDAMSPLTPTADDFPPVPVVGGLLAALPADAPPASVEPLKTEDATVEETPVVAVPEEPASVPEDKVAEEGEKALPPAPEPVVLMGETPGPEVALSTSEPAALAEVAEKVDAIVEETSPAEPEAPVVEEPAALEEAVAVEEPAAPEPELAPVEVAAPAEPEAPAVEEAAPVVEEASAPEPVPVVEEAPAVEQVSVPVAESAPEPVVEAAPEPVVEAAPEPVVEEAAPVVEETPAVEEAVPVPEPEAVMEEAAPVVEEAPVVEPEEPAAAEPEPTVEEVSVPEPEPIVEEAAAPEPEPVIEAPAAEPEPIVEAPAPEPEPVVEEAPAPAPEPVVEETPAAEPEAVVEEVSAPAPVEETSAPEPEPAAEETPVAEAAPAVEETPAAPEPEPVPESAPVEEAPAPAEEAPAAPEEVAAAEEHAPAAEETVAEPVIEESAPAPVVAEPVAEEPAAPVVEEASAVEEPAPAPAVEESAAAEEPAVEESAAPAEAAVSEVRPEEPAASAEQPVSHAEEPLVEEKHENGAVHPPAEAVAEEKADEVESH